MSADSHIDLATLAQCADGTLPEERAQVVRDHLASCRSCLAAYVDAVRYRAAWLVDSEAFRLEKRDETLLGMSRPGGATESSRRPPGTYWRFAIAGSLAALVVASIVMPVPPPSPTLGFGLAPATLEATAQSIPHGLVVPGAEQFADRSQPERRSGAGSSSIELEAELKVAIEAYESGSRGPEASARVVAALLANGDLAAANDYGEEGLRAHPNDVPLIVFVAVTKARASDLAAAERLLRRAARHAPRDPIVALDLGMVLCRQARGSEAQRWLERAAASPVAPIAARGWRELRSCEGADAGD